MSGLANVLLIFIGLAGGIAVGGGFVAFITVLDIIPRLAQVTRTFSYVYMYEWAIVGGVLFFTVIDLSDVHFRLPDWSISIVGGLMGIFVGLLAAALTEVVNVIPILAKRLQVQVHLVFLLMAMVFGKVVGSLLQWLIF
jgi:stage V sporulation protein AB